MKMLGLTATACAAFAALAQAQFPVTPTRVTAHSFGGAGAAAETALPTYGFGRIAAADLGGDLITDYVVAAEDAVGVVWGGMFAHCYFWLTSPNRTTGAPAFAPVRMSGGDAVAIATATGLELWRVDAGNWALTKTSIANTTIAGAKQLASADVDGDGDDDLVGLTSSGTSAFVAYQASGAFGAPAATFSIGGLGLALAALQWDGSGALEVAVLRTDGLRVFTSSGSTVDSLIAGASASGLLVVLHDGSRERAAWIDEVGSAAALRVAGRDPSGAVIVEPTLSLGSLLHPTGIASYDGNFDGYPDLVITHRFSHLEIVLQHQDTGTTPSASGSYSLSAPFGVWLLPADATDPSASNSTSTAWPVAGDLDGDFDIDIGFASAAFGEVRSIVAELTDPTEFTNRLNPQFEPAYEGNVVTQGSTGELFNITAGYRIPVSSLTETATHLEVVIHAADPVSQCTPDFAGGPLVNEIYPIANLVFPDSTDADQRPILPVTVIDFPYGTDFEMACTLRVRMVRTDRTGAVVQAWTPTFATFETLGDPVADATCTTWLGGTADGYEFDLDVPADAPTSGGSYTERPVPPVPPPPSNPPGGGG
ncbi:MAG: FG-GAP-like repeat-containing protein [Planctomycetes bacterium]|nr:FG-GAP-like repeat-containing protein [Planctomycetota bacterium]